MRTFLRGVLLVAFATLLPAAAFAQASIAGSAKDASGATLPGVTVEAASPVLIEKVRTTVTDDRGLFRIVALPPGTYTLTFQLPGFNQVKREGIELTGAFTAQIDAEMTVGGAGGRNNEGRMQVDGLNTGAGLGGSGVSTYVADISNAQEVVTTTSGGSAKRRSAGPRSASFRRAAATRLPATSISPAWAAAWWGATTRTV